MPETHEPPTTSPAVPTHDHTHSRHDHTHPYHSRTLPRHSRVGGNPPRCAQLPKDSTPPAVHRNRHNATESDEPQRILVPARARGNYVPDWYESTQCPPTPTPFPRRRESPAGMNCAQAAADSAYRLELPVMPIYRTEPVFESRCI